MRTSFTALMALVLFTLFTACSSPAPATLPDLTPGVWNEFAGGADTVCAGGSDYSYYAHVGSVNKLVIDFQGGGACWDGASCSSPYSEPNPNIGFGLYADTVSTSDLDDGLGLYDRDNSENPVGDWYHVFIPYCTGDLHVGNSERVYTNPFDSSSYTVQHKGAVNARAALEWTFANFSAPEAVFVTGCSAGAYGAAFWTDTVAERYPDADIYELGDCGAGVSTDAWAQQLSESWDTTSALPDLSFNSSFVPATYRVTLGAHANLTMAQYNTLFDSTQIFFYAYGTGRLPVTQELGLEWSGAMLGSLASIDAASDRFVSYTSVADDNADPIDGTEHCILPRDSFYTTTVSGRSFRDWLDDLVNGRPVESVTTPLAGL